MTEDNPVRAHIKALLQRLRDQQRERERIMTAHGERHRHAKR